MYKILIVDDNQLLLDSLSLYLRGKDYEVETCSSSMEALVKCNEIEWDLILLDYYLTDMTGDVLLELMYKINSNFKIVIFTSKPSEEIELQILESNAFDFISKKDNPKIIYKRIRNILEGQYSSQEKLVSKTSNVVVDVMFRTVFKDNEEIILSNTEFNILVLFMKNMNKTLTRDFFYEELWISKHKYLEELRAIDVHILKIRKKLNVDNIVTRKGVGYVWQEKSSS